MWTEWNQSIPVLRYIYFNLLNKSIRQKKIEVKMNRIVVSIALMFICYFIISKLHGEFVEVVPNETHVEITENLKMEKIGENDMNENERINMELKKFYSEHHTKCQSTIEFEKLVKNVDNYVQRYISLFLITSNLLDHKIKDISENITINLEVSISGEDLFYLQGYSKSTKASSYQKNFSRLDAIFSKIARLKKESYRESAKKSFWSFFNSFNVLNNHYFSHFFSFFIIFLTIWMIYRYIFHKYIWGFIGIFINSMIIWESLQLYWRKIKEADIENYVNTLQSKAMPEDCDPANTRWYHSIKNFFSENKCLHYYKNLIKNPVEEISLLKCIIDTYSFYLFQTPFRIFGASIRDFTGEVSALWPWPFKYLTNIPIAVFFGVILLLFILILCGKRLKVSLWGAGLEIGDVKALTEKEKRATIINEISKREPIRVVHKLRPWTKTRFPKRLDVDSERRRKFFLKALKSAFEVREEQNKVNFGDSNESLYDYKIKHD